MERCELIVLKTVSCMQRVIFFFFKRKSDRLQLSLYFLVPVMCLEHHLDIWQRCPRICIVGRE